MFAWRRAGPMLFALLFVVLLVADRSAARAEEQAPGAANPDLCQRAKFRVVVDVATSGPNEASGQQVTATTLVKTHNALGRLYLAVIKPFHRLIVPAMLRQVVT